MKMSAITIVAATAVLVLMGSSASAGLIHQWTFDDSANRLADTGSSPSGLAIVSGSAGYIYGRDPNPARAMLLFGYSKAATTVTSFGSSFTMETWLYLDAAGSNGWLRPMNGWTQSPCSLHMGNNMIGTTVGANPSYSATATAGGAWSAPMYTWIFIAVVADAANGVAKTYAKSTNDAALTLVAQGAYNGSSTAANAFALGDSTKYAGSTRFEWVVVHDQVRTVDQIIGDMSGNFVIPEPATMSLLVLGGLAGLIRRHRNCGR
ncbi:MAG: PEP-CTERM sorting domain-containing protein [Planctomycetaceae bacterium]|nr:PEP-CTERM sorting domain-containing protein [Planctomycetaceae bacterium]